MWTLRSRSGELRETLKVETRSRLYTERVPIASLQARHPILREPKMTRKKYQPPPNNQPLATLPLFAWAESVRRRTRPIAVSHVQRLYNVSPSVARLYAELAGLFVEDLT